MGEKERLSANSFNLSPYAFSGKRSPGVEAELVSLSVVTLLVFEIVHSPSASGFGKSRNEFFVISRFRDGVDYDLLQVVREFEDDEFRLCVSHTKRI